MFPKGLKTLFLGFLGACVGVCVYTHLYNFIYPGSISEALEAEVIMLTLQKEELGLSQSRILNQ